MHQLQKDKMYFQRLIIVLKISNKKLKNKVIDTIDTTATIIFKILHKKTNMKSLNVIHKTFNGFNKFSIIIDLMFLGIISIVHFLCYVENLIFFFFLHHTVIDRTRDIDTRCQ